MRWGVDEHLPDLRSRSPRFKVRRWYDGEIIGSMDTERHKEKFGGPYVQLHRADLQMALLKVATRNGVRIHTKSRVVDIDLDRPAIMIEGGLKVEADLVIGADGKLGRDDLLQRDETLLILGVKSVGRRKISGKSSLDTIFTGLAVYRATLDMDTMMRYAELSQLVREPGLNLW